MRACRELFCCEDDMCRRYYGALGGYIVLKRYHFILYGKLFSDVLIYGTGQVLIERMYLAEA